MFDRVTETVIKHDGSTHMAIDTVSRNVEQRLKALTREFQNSKVLGENTVVTETQAFRMACIAFEYHCYRTRMLPTGSEFGNCQRSHKEVD
jgi:hypothetical protein